ncbi:hypothetical protein TNCV_662571 [Trichonephila clavipes]|nr:hypothetical protein TNCV_662571 [Trichonephila clavipes]
MRISHKRLTIWKTTFAVLLPRYGHKSSKLDVQIGLHPSQPSTVMRVEFGSSGPTTTEQLKKTSCG